MAFGKNVLVARGYRRVDRDQVLLLPPDLREWLPADHLALTVVEIVDQLDLSGLHAGYRLGGVGRQAFDPAMMTSLLIYAYCCGQRSSRQIQRLCRSDVAFRVITAQQFPDHCTIAKFRAVHEHALMGLFVQVLAVCRAAGMGRVGVIAVDGTVIAANASPRKNHSEEGLRRRAEEVFAQAADQDEAEDGLFGADRSGDELPADLAPGSGRAARIAKALAQLEAERAAAVAADVAAAQARADAAAAAAEGVRAKAQRRHEQRPPRAGRRPVAEHKTVLAAQGRADAAAGRVTDAAAGNGKNAQALARTKPRRNITDPDSRSMPGKAGGGWVQGFNAQFGVTDDHLIAGVTVSGQPNDVGQYETIVAATEVGVAAMGAEQIGVVLADAGYCSNANLTAPGPARFIATGRDRNTRPRPPGPIADMEFWLEPGTLGRATYSRRSAIVEPVIGHIKDRIGLRRFSRRGHTAILAELTLAAIAHNIRRLATI